MKPFLKRKKNTTFVEECLENFTTLPKFPNSTFASQAQWSRRFLDVRLASFVKPMTRLDLRLTFSFYGEVWWLKKIRISSYHFGMTGFVISVSIFYFNPPLDVCLASNHSHIFPESKLQVTLNCVLCPPRLREYIDTSGKRIHVHLLLLLKFPVMKVKLGKSQIKTFELRYISFQKATVPIHQKVSTHMRKMRPKTKSVQSKPLLEPITPLRGKWFNSLSGRWKILRFS